MSVADENQLRVMVDTAPQLIGSGFPYVSFGVEPTLFDAPATTDRNVDWVARSFLTASPDRLTRVVAPVLGLRWGYTINAGAVIVKELVQASDDDWKATRDVIAGHFSEWVFMSAWASVDAQPLNAPRSSPQS